MFRSSGLDLVLTPLGQGDLPGVACGCYTRGIKTLHPTLPNTCTRMKGKIDTFLRTFSNGSPVTQRAGTVYSRGRGSRGTSYPQKTKFCQSYTLTDVGIAPHINLQSFQIFAIQEINQLPNNFLRQQPHKTYTVFSLSPEGDSCSI